jgi:diacylglycerol O-acyltransferase / wax synthase
MSTRLRAQDAAFLAEETVYAPRQVATLAILDPGPDGFDHEKLIASIGERIAFVPRYRQRVLSVPGNLGRAVWTDDEDFDLSYHVRRSAVPRPGSSEQLRDLVARLIARRLDRERPLWEAYLVEGLEHGRVALLIKSHEALVDGSRTVDLAQVLLDETDRIREVPGEDWQPRPAPRSVELLAGSVLDNLRRSGELVSQATASVRGLRGRLPRVGRYSGDQDGPLSASLSQQRRFVTVATRLADYRRVRDAHGGTVNDVILAAVTGGLRHWLLTRAEQIRPTSRLRALVPMSVLDDEAEPTSLGSQVVGHLLSLPIGEASPVMRLHQVSYALKAHKATGRAVAASKLAALPGFAPTTFHALAARVAESEAPTSYELGITNVPGPQEPLYMAGARMVETYPALPLSPGHAIALGVTSYDGGVYFGIVADRDAVPDAEVFGQCLEEALAELVETTTESWTRAPRGRDRPDRRDS